ncbi:hypothetical protein HAX54_039838 [Datura stramonium]|uniref:Uncharacterized protein n=1 Tax=Datura stramonium TaxID=4076 RepID=A0ABS8SJD0_DATST|nr:hypothetical protein [Datura stramonium]
MARGGKQGRGRPRKMTMSIVEETIGIRFVSEGSKGTITPRASQVTPCSIEISEGALPTEINQQTGNKKLLKLSSPITGTSCNTGVRAEINGTVTAEPVVDVKIDDDNRLPKPGWTNFFKNNRTANNDQQRNQVMRKQEWRAKRLVEEQLIPQDVVLNKIVDYTSPDGRVEDITVIQREQTKLVS